MLAPAQRQVVKLTKGVLLLNVYLGTYFNEIWIQNDNFCTVLSPTQRQVIKLTKGALLLNVYMGTNFNDNFRTRKYICMLF